MTTLTDSGQGMDVAIGGLGFKLAISKDQPYERATAQFRKEQFDSANIVGDQSLTGWWTRAQLSFHKGAGTKFYEVLDGADVLNTYAHAEGLDVSTPGRATPYPDPELVAAQTWRVFAQPTSGRADLAVGLNTFGSARYVTSAGAGANITLATAGGQWCCYHANDGHTYFTTTTNVERLDSGSDTTVSRWTAGVGAGLELRKIWSAKDRVFIVSADGHWWAVNPDSTGTLDTTNSFWNSGLACAIPGSGFAFQSNNWTLTEGPAAVYAAYGNKVYAIKPDTTGVVPTLTAGVVAAQLAKGEYIYDIKYNLGTLLLATDLGIRVCLVGSDGDLVVGPLSPALQEATSVDAWGNFFVVAGQGDTNGGVSALIAMVDATTLASGESLEFAHTYYYKGASGVRLKIKAMDSGIYAGTDGSWSDTHSEQFRRILSSNNDFNLQKILVTGFHRFGTLESKFYSSIRVRTDPQPGSSQVVLPGSGHLSGGTIDVYAVKLDDTETLLGQVDATTSGADFDINLTAEALAFKFVFNASGLSVPYLVGYQLRALPAPRRQRMIRVPLLLMDNERGAGGAPMAGYDGSAWDRLSALETMEASGNVHDWQDFRTGETGTVFIESVEHRGTTAPSSMDDGFGGIVWLTLRKID